MPRPQHRLPVRLLPVRELTVSRPDMDGFTFLDRLKDNPKAPEFPVLVLSAHDNLSRARRCPPRSLLLIATCACTALPGWGCNFSFDAPCLSGEVKCGETCTDLNENSNCGRCGYVCAGGAVCQGRVCTNCAPGVSCAGTCVDPSTDPRWCGVNGACAGGTSCSLAAPICSRGACICPSAVVCGGQCIDPYAETRHCGARGDCAGVNAGTDCIEATGDACGGCLDGACVVAGGINGISSCGCCQPGQICADGRCVCPNGRINCLTACVDPSTSLSHCGASVTCTGPSAGVRCTTAQVCVDGVCVPRA